MTSQDRILKTLRKNKAGLTMSDLAAKSSTKLNLTETIINLLIDERLVKPVPAQDHYVFKIKKAA